MFTKMTSDDAVNIVSDLATLLSFMTDFTRIGVYDTQMAELVSQLKEDVTQLKQYNVPRPILEAWFNVYLVQLIVHHPYRLVDASIIRKLLE